MSKDDTFNVYTDNIKEIGGFEDFPIGVETAGFYSIINVNDKFYLQVFNPTQSSDIYRKQYDLQDSSLGMKVFSSKGWVKNTELGIEEINNALIGYVRLEDLQSDLAEYAKSNEIYTKNDADEKFVTKDQLAEAIASVTTTTTTTSTTEPTTTTTTEAPITYKVDTSGLDGNSHYTVNKVSDGVITITDDAYTENSYVTIKNKLGTDKLLDVEVTSADPSFDVSGWNSAFKDFVATDSNKLNSVSLDFGFEEDGQTIIKKVFGIDTKGAKYTANVDDTNIPVSQSGIIYYPASVATQVNSASGSMIIYTSIGLTLLISVVGSNREVVITQGASPVEPTTTSTTVEPTSTTTSTTVEPTTTSTTEAPTSTTSTTTTTTEAGK